MENDYVLVGKARQGSPFLNPKEAAYYLGMSHRTLQTMRMDGRGPHYRKHGRLIRYHIEDLLEWSKSPHCRSASKKREQ